MTLKTHLTAALTALSLVATLPALAQAQTRGDRPAPPPFEQLDMNGDGQINAADLAAFAAARFSETDTDGDGLLSAPELRAQAEARAIERAGENVTRMLNRMDQNGDGALSADELPEEMGTRILRRADQDGDGALSEAEYASVLDRMGERGGKGPRRRAD